MLSTLIHVLFFSFFFLSIAREKFSIQQDKTLTVMDDGGVTIDAYVFPEVVIRDVCLVIHGDFNEGMSCVRIR